MSKELYYIYVYCNPKFLYKVKNSANIRYLPFYVGKGKGDRYLSHLKKSHNRVLNKYIQKMTEENLEPFIYKIKYFENEKEAYKFENSLIKELGVVYSMEGSLFNKYDNGAIYEIYDSSYIKDLIKEYEKMVCSDPNVMLNESYLEKIEKNKYELCPFILNRLKHYIKMGISIKDCLSIFKIEYKHIFYNISEDFISKWVVNSKETIFKL